MTPRTFGLLLLNLVAMAGVAWLVLGRSPVRTCERCAVPVAVPIRAPVQPGARPGATDGRLLTLPWEAFGTSSGGAGVLHRWDRSDVAARWSSGSTSDGVSWTLEFESSVTYTHARVQLAEGAVARLRFRPRVRTPEGDIIEDPLVREVALPPPRGGHVEVRAEMKGGPPGNFKGWRHVALTLEAVGASDPGILQSVQLETPSAGLSGAVSEQGVDRYGVRRPALTVPAGMGVRWAPQVPPSKTLSFGVGGLDGVQGRVVARASGGTTVLWEGAADRWTDVRVDLPAADVPVEIEVTASGDGVLALADPRWLTDAVDPDAPDVLLYLVDTLRADRVGAYGYPRAQTPVMDRLAEEGVQFSRAQSVAAWTMPAVPSVLTGLHPVSHDIRLRGRARLDDAFDVVAEPIRDAGWRTAAFTASPMALGGTGLDRGFGRVSRPDRWAGELGPLRHPTADQLHAALLTWVDERPERPFFAYLQTLEVHEYHREEVYGSPASDAYDRAVADADSKLGTLLAALSAHRDRPLIVVLVSDHGERLGERDGQYGHGLGLYQEELHIPLVLWRSDVSWGGTIAHPVSNLDVTPTLLGLLGLPPLDDVDGVDLTPMLRPGVDLARMPVTSRLVEFWWTPGTPTRHARLDASGRKLMGWEGGRFEAYDLASDPCEDRPLEDRPGDRAAMASTLERLQQDARRHAERVGSDTAPLEVDADQMEALEALGYVRPD